MFSCAKRLLLCCGWRSFSSWCWCFFLTPILNKLVVFGSLDQLFLILSTSCLHLCISQWQCCFLEEGIASYQTLCMWKEKTNFFLKLLVETKTIFRPRTNATKSKLETKLDSKNRLKSYSPSQRFLNVACVLEVPRGILHCPGPNIPWQASLYKNILSFHPLLFPWSCEA